VLGQLERHELGDGDGAARLPSLRLAVDELAVLGDLLLDADPPTWQVIEDVIDGSVTVVTSEFGESTLPDGRSTLYTGERLEMTARDADPAHARMHNEVVYRLREDGSEILIEANGTTRTTETDFHMNVGLRVTLDGALFFERGWLETIPRDLV